MLHVVAVMNDWQCFKASFENVKVFDKNPILKRPDFFEKLIAALHAVNVFQFIVPA